MKTDFQNKIKSLNSDANTKFLVAVSGGPDSMALLHLFLSADLNFSVAHCNFKLRLPDADQEEAFVKEICEKNKIPFYSISFDTKTEVENSNESIQMVARRMRYDWFHQLKKEHNFDFIATAHHLDDRIETFFINLFRGTGINGLAALSFQNEDIIRPLIEFTKREILEYLESNKFEFKLDSSNESLKYDRNKIRHQLIPKIEKIAPEFRNRFLESFRVLEEEKKMLEKDRNKYLKDFLKTTNDGFQIDIENLKSDIHFFWLVQYLGGSSGQTDELKKLIKSQTGKKIDIQDFELFKVHDHIQISQKKIGFEEITIDSFLFENEFISIEESSSKIESFEESTLYLDSSKLRLPLKLRIWSQGDRFKPLGMNGSKLVSDYLTDRKISGPQRQNIKVLECEGKIVGIPGYTCDENYKITSKTSKALILRIKH